jgi:hypothetical protein
MSGGRKRVVIDILHELGLTIFILRWIIRIDRPDEFATTIFAKRHATTTAITLVSSRYSKSESLALNVGEWYAICTALFRKMRLTTNHADTTSVVEPFASGGGRESII